MKIGFVVPSLTSGGAEKAASIFASLLAKYPQNQVVIFAFFDTEHKYAIHPNVKFVPIFENIKKYKKTNMFAKLAKIRKIIKCENVDILIPFVTYVGYILSFLFRFRKFALIETIRTSPFIIKNVIKRKLRDYSIYHSDGVIFQTKYQSSYFNLKKIKKYIYINNPVLTNEIKKTINTSTISKFVFIGRLCEDKNPMLLLKAFSIFLKDNPSCTLDIYGDGPLAETCSKYVIDSHIEKNVTFHGFVNLDRYTLCKYDCMLLTSVLEGMPNSLLEAMSCGLVCVSSIYNDGVREIIEDGKDGFLFENGNINSLLDVLKKIRELDSEKITLISNCAANKITSNFSTEYISNKMFEFLLNYEKK